MASTIRVTTKVLNNKAEELRGLAERFKSEVNGLGDSESRLASMWEGEAQKAFHQQFVMDREKFDRFYTGILKYIQRLKETANAYDLDSPDTEGIMKRRNRKEKERRSKKWKDN